MSFLFLASFLEVATYAGYVLIAVLVLLSMITVHEFGHYISGKLLGFGIEEFSIGFGPKLYQKKKKDGELFSVRLLPLGGYCSFLGEDEENDNPKAFNRKSPWKRIIVLFSGAFMNYLFAVIIISITFGVYGRTALICTKITPTEEYGAEYLLKDKDVILTANGRNVYLISDLINALSDKSNGDFIDFKVKRNGEEKAVKVVLRADGNFKNLEDVKTLYDALGIVYGANEEGNISSAELYSTSVRLGFFKTVANGFDYSFRLAGTVFTVLGQLLTGKLGVASMGGTVTTVAMTAEAIKSGGLKYLLSVSSFIGVNLAVFNLLPFPALDGARIVFCLIESIIGKPVNRRVEGLVHTIGFVLILLFAVFIDLQRCF